MQLLPESFRDEPLAYFLTWTTYGAWLPGDRRGWVDGAGDVRSPNPRLARLMGRGLCRQAVTLTLSQRACVLKALRQHAELRGWQLHAVAIRTQHVHVVVAASAVAPTAVVQQLKAWSTRALRNALAFNGRAWSRGQSIRRLYGEKGLAAVVSYVCEHQDRSRA